MKKLLSLIIGLNILAAPASAQFTIKGTQYLMVDGDPKPIADNWINYIRCDRTINCDKMYRELMDIADDRTLDRRALIVDRFSELIPNPASAFVDTNINGQYKLTCPSKKCLVFSMANTKTSYGLWVQYVDKKNTTLDLVRSNAWLKDRWDY